MAYGFVTQSGTKQTLYYSSCESGEGGIANSNCSCYICTLRVKFGALDATALASDSE